MPLLCRVLLATEKEVLPEWTLTEPFNEVLSHGASLVARESCRHVSRILSRSCEARSDPAPDPGNLSTERQRAREFGRFRAERGSFRSAAFALGPKPRVPTGRCGD